MTPLCALADIPDNSARGYRIDGASIFVVRRDNHLYAYVNACPHLGVELNWVADQFLDRDGTLIQCATHGALFAIESGSCLAGPCFGKTLEAVPVQIRDGLVLVTPPAPV